MFLTFELVLIPCFPIDSHNDYIAITFDYFKCCSVYMKNTLHNTEQLIFLNDKQPTIKVKCIQNRIVAKERLRSFSNNGRRLHVTISAEYFLLFQRTIFIVTNRFKENINMADDTFRHQSQSGKTVFLRRWVIYKKQPIC